MAIRNYNAQQGQSIYDICLMTYGTLDNFSNTSYSALFKLMQDNSFSGVNQYPYPGQKFSWDDTLVADQNVSITNTVAKVNYATRAGSVGAIYYGIEENGKPAPKQQTVAPIAPPLQQTDGYFYVYPGDPGIGADGSGNFMFTDTRLKGLSGYAVYATQLPDMLNDVPPGLTYNPTAGSFTVQIPDFYIVTGYRLIVFTNYLGL